MSKIEWTEQTVNPIIGCSKVIEGKKWNGKTLFVRSQLDNVLKRKKPTRFFWGSIGDMFHESVELSWLDACFDVMRDTPHHTHMILTKRINSLHLDYLCQRQEWPLQNVWLGVTAENQATADERIPVLLKTPAAKRYVSVEPMLERICLKDVFITRENCKRKFKKLLCGLDLVICGAETGQGARPIDPRWVYDLHEQCQIDDVPFFFKKWGPRPAMLHMAFEDIANYEKAIHTVHGKVLQEFPA